MLRCGMHSAVAVGSAARGASAPTEGGEGRGHIVATARLQLVYLKNVIFNNLIKTFSTIPVHV